MVEAVEDIEHPIVDFIKPDMVMHDGALDEALVSHDPDRTGLAHEAHDVVARVLLGFDLLRHRVRRSSVELRRCVHPDPLVRSDGIELIPKLFRSLLLFRYRVLRGHRGLRLQRPVHPLVDSVLLRVTGFDELGVDLQSDEVHAELQQSCQRIGSKRYHVVTSDPLGKTVLAEQQIEVRLGALKAYRLVPLALEDAVHSRLTR